MGKSKATYIDSEESKNWNAAEKYSTLKIMKHLTVLDDLEVISKFGTLDIISEFILTEQDKIQARIMALRRYHHTLLQLISNTVFALKKDDKELFVQYKNFLKELEPKLDEIGFNQIDQRTNKPKIRINEKTFNFLYETFSYIKEKINDPLNKAELIFTGDDAMDPDELKARITEDMIYGG